MRNKMTNLQKYDLLELPWTDVAASIKAGNDSIMIPVGSMEKHGHHVPLGVDSYTTMGSVELAICHWRPKADEAIPEVIALMRLLRAEALATTGRGRNSIKIS